MGYLGEVQWVSVGQHDYGPWMHDMSTNGLQLAISHPNRDEF